MVNYTPCGSNVDERSKYDEGNLRKEHSLELTLLMNEEKETIKADTILQKSTGKLLYFDWENKESILLHHVVSTLSKSTES